MHVGITAIMISVAMVAAVAGLAVGGKYIAMQVPKSPEVTIQTKAAEIGNVISRNETGIVFGFSTGGLPMVEKELGMFNVTLSLPGGSQSVLIGKRGLCIVGGSITSAPKENFSVLSAGKSSGFLDDGSRVRIFNGMLEGERAAFIMPVPAIGYACSASDLNVRTHSVRIIVGSIEGPFSAAGTFDLLLLKSCWKDLAFSRYVDLPGGVEIFVDGVKALSFSVSRGDKVTVELGRVCYTPIWLR